MAIPNSKDHLTPIVNEAEYQRRVIELRYIQAKKRLNLAAQNALKCIQNLGQGKADIRNYGLMLSIIQLYDEDMMKRLCNEGVSIVPELILEIQNEKFYSSF